MQAVNVLTLLCMSLIIPSADCACYVYTLYFTVFFKCTSPCSEDMYGSQSVCAGRVQEVKLSLFRSNTQCSCVLSVVCEVHIFLIFMLWEFFLSHKENPSYTLDRGLRLDKVP
jgi:hypothetical protein